jgi:hypothetical protein
MVNVYCTCLSHGLSLAIAMASQHDAEVTVLASVGDIRYDAISLDRTAGGVVRYLKRISGLGESKIS